jgi:TetR/AcrR family transcriptional regulator, transcriptional repressor of bet genes
VPKLVNHEVRREQIAFAACEVVAKHGFERATVAHIASAAGYTTGMVAHYFKSKQDIILAALRLILRRIETRLTPGSSQRGDLLSVLSESLPVNATRLAECAFWTAFWGQVSTDRSARKLNAWVHQEYARVFERCIAAHWPQWKKWTPRVRADVLLSLMTFINGLTASAVTSRGDWPAERQVAQLGLQLRLLHDWASRSSRS